jgi:hypothetical protein
MRFICDTVVPLSFGDPFVILSFSIRLAKLKMCSFKTDPGFKFKNEAKFPIQAKCKNSDCTSEPNLLTDICTKNVLEGKRFRSILNPSIGGIKPPSIRRSWSQEEKEA